MYLLNSNVKISNVASVIFIVTRYVKMIRYSNDVIYLIKRCKL